jgi:hypothetical protein
MAAETVDQQWCRDRMTHFKCPTSVVFVDVLPKSGTLWHFLSTVEAEVTKSQGPPIESYFRPCSESPSAAWSASC